MNFDVRAVDAHPTVLALDDDTRLVLLALLRAADHWGEIDSRQALSVTSATLAGLRSQQTRDAVLRRLHTVRLVHHDREAGRLCLWTPRALEDADVFGTTDAELSALETEINGPIPGLTAAQSARVGR